MARKLNQSKKQVKKMFNLSHDVEFGVECAPAFMLLCPKCEKRTIDVSGRPERTIKVRYKCPHCSNIVVTPIFATRAKTNI